MEYAIKQSDNSFNVFNVGSGDGYSVLEMVKSFEKATGNKVPYEIVDRRPGDVEAVYADTSKVTKELGFKTKRNLEEMLKSAWDWEQALAKE